ncbi:MAG: flavin reductase [Deltaproteobacteria bacterium]|nr:flavin reductase [Deltaproteobacteria bacterium]
MDRFFPVRYSKSSTEPLARCCNNGGSKDKLLTPVVLVTCQDEGAKPNIITLAWVGVANSDPSMISIAIRPERYSYGIIKGTGEFVANLPTTAILKEMDFCGVV